MQLITTFSKINFMTKYVVAFLMLLIIISSSCQKNKSQKTELRKEIKSKLSNIDTYNGNAIIFFTEKNHADPHVYIIQIEEKSSKVFADKTFDIKSAIRGKCSIFTSIGYYHWNTLWGSKEKQVYKLKICNINPDYIYYVKAWISYKNMVENNRRRTNKLLSDSCAVRNLYYPIGDKNAKDIEFKILK
jgi:hypothetical protein